MGRIPFFSLAIALLISGAPGVHAEDHLVPAEFATIQEAIDFASDGDSVIVSPGTYVENLDFGGKAITVVSSDGPDVTTIDGGASGSVVTFQNGEGASSVIEGFTITNGLADDGGGIYCVGSFPTILNNTISNNEVTTVYGAGIEFYPGAAFAGDPGVVQGNSIFQNVGGAVYCVNYYTVPAFIGNTVEEHQLGGGIRILTSGTTNVVVTDNTITNNDAPALGGGLAISGGVQTVDNNTLQDNTAGFAGGGAWLAPAGSGSSVSLTNSTISGNFTAGYGGGVYLSGYYGDPGVPLTIANCTISGNENAGVFGGGGVCTFYGSVAVTNSLVVNNSSTASGGGVYCYSFDATEPAILNSTLSGNSGTSGSGAAFVSYSATVTNSILWGNVGDQVSHSYGPGYIYADHNIIEGGPPVTGTGNLDADPLFVTGSGGDFFLSQIAAGQGADSPAVDAGDPASTLIPGTTRTDNVPDSGVIDMGFHRLLPTPTYYRGDVDGDDTLNALVDAIFLLAFGFQGGPTPPCLDEADVDGDGNNNALVDTIYLLAFGFQGGPEPPAPFPCGSALSVVGCLNPGC